MINHFKKAISLKRKQVFIFRITICFLFFCATGFSFPYTEKNVDETLKKPNQEQFIIKGKVTNAKGEPLIGATVVIKERKTGIDTDFDGDFTLKVSKGDTLIFSYIGYNSKEVVIVKGKTTYNAILTEYVNTIDEVIISTGFQKIPKERATGSFVSVKKVELEKPSASISERLVGLVPGIQSTVSANGTPSFTIRGQSRLRGSSSPLIVYDGFPLDDDFSSINPNDIESITVLKDAAAASIWGARSANGVIVITSKKAKKGKIVAEYNSFFRISEGIDLDYTIARAKPTSYLNYQVKAFETEGFGNLNQFTPNNVGFNVFGGYSLPWTALNEYRLGEITEIEKDNRLKAYGKLDNTEQLEKYLLRSPTVNQHNFSIRGSLGAMNAKLNILYEKRSGFFIRDNNERYLATFTTNTDLVKDKLKLKFSGSLGYRKSTIGGKRSLAGNINLLRNLAPWDMLANNKGELNDLSYLFFYKPNLDRHFNNFANFTYKSMFYNPVSEIRNITNTSEDTNFRINVSLGYEPIKDLKLIGNVQIESFSNKSERIDGENSFYVRSFVNITSTWNRNPNSAATPLVPKGSFYRGGFKDITLTTFRPLLTYNKNIAEKHNINFLAGSEVVNRVSNGTTLPILYGYDPKTSFSRSLLKDPDSFSTRIFIGSPYRFWRDFLPIVNSYPKVFTNKRQEFDKSIYRTFSAFGNLSYTYNHKYTLSGSYRTDASNAVTDNSSLRYNPFWSVGGSWKIHKEDFFKSSWIDNLSLRTSYGVAGNTDRSASTLPLISLGNGSYLGQIFTRLERLGNPNLRWERTASTNIGIDFAMLDKKLTGSVEIYNNKITDLIVNQDITSTNGSSKELINGAAMNNRGIEIGLNYTLPTFNEKIIWNTSLNYSYNRSRVTKLIITPKTQVDFYHTVENRFRQGQDPNTLWTLKYNGLVNIGTAADPEILPSIISNDGKKVATFNDNIDASSFSSFITNSGTTVAPHVMSFNNSFKYDNFTLSFLVTAKFGHVFRRQSFDYRTNPQFASLASNGALSVNDKVDEVLNGDPTKIVPVYQLKNRQTSFRNFLPNLSYLVQDASFIRFREISLGYTIPKEILNKRGISGIRLYAQINNVGAIFFNDFNEDPEYPKGGGYNSSNRTTPFANSFTLGVNLTF